MEVLRPFADTLGAHLTEDSFAPHASRIGCDFAVPDWADGRINMVEAAVLDLYIRTLRPDVIVEVGVASGVSSAAILSSLSTLGPSPTPRLRSYDIMTRCYFDESRAVGQAVREMVPQHASDQLIKRGGAKTAADDLPARSVRLAFIDANHGHPAPTADLIDLSPCLAPGAWVVLHDIRLSKVMREREPNSARQVYGPEVLFEWWPGTKTKGDTFASNIGAIRVNHPSELTAEALAELIHIPWEPVADSPHVRRTLGRR